MSTQSDLKKVLILTTGGTIATQIEAPMIPGKKLIKSIPQINEYADIEVEEFSNLPSSKMTPGHWLQLGQKINSIFLQDQSMSGIVITHGTDSMEETSFFLSLTLADSRPVVMTGSMRTPDEIAADGPGNLVNAIRVASSNTADSRSVLVVMNERIFSGTDIWKSHNRNVDTFRSRYGPIGQADPDSISFSRFLPRLSPEQKFNIRELVSLPRVDIVSDFTGFDASIIDAYLDQSPVGLVMQSFAGGRLSEGAQKGLEQLDDEYPLVIASKVPTGRIVGDPNPGLNAIYARNLPANKARILLMLALATGVKRSSLPHLFSVT